MARYRDPDAPAGRVVFGGEVFVDGVTADIEVGPETARLFQAAGITPESGEHPDSGSEAVEPEKPAQKRTK